MYKKLAIFYFNLSILIINKLTLNSVAPLFLSTFHLPPFLFLPTGEMIPPLKTPALFGGNLVIGNK
jgi:hypothetical protein